MRELLSAWRDTAETVAADQWRRFFETGRFEKHLSANQEAAVPAIRGAKRQIAGIPGSPYHVTRTRDK